MSPARSQFFSFEIPVGASLLCGGERLTVKWFWKWRTSILSLKAVPGRNRLNGCGK